MERLQLLLQDKAKAEQKLRSIVRQNDLVIDSSVFKVGHSIIDGVLGFEVLIIVDGISLKGEGTTVGSAVENAVQPSLPFMRERSHIIKDSVKALLA